MGRLREWNTRRRDRARERRYRLRRAVAAGWGRLRAEVGGRELMLVGALGLIGQALGGWASPLAQLVVGLVVFYLATWWPGPGRGIFGVRWMKHQASMGKKPANLVSKE